MDKFLRKNKLLKLTRVEIDNLNRPISIKEIYFYLKTFKENPRPRWLPLINSAKHLRKKWYPFFTIKFKRWEYFPKHSESPALLRFQNLATHYQKLHTDIPHEYRCKNSKQNFSKLNLTVYKKDNMSWPSSVYPVNAK